MARDVDKNLERLTIDDEDAKIIFADILKLSGEGDGSDLPKADIDEDDEGESNADVQPI